MDQIDSAHSRIDTFVFNQRQQEESLVKRIMLIKKEIEDKTRSTDENLKSFLEQIAEFGVKLTSAPSLQEIKMCQDQIRELKSELAQLNPKLYESLGQMVQTTVMRMNQLDVTVE